MLMRNYSHRRLQLRFRTRDGAEQLQQVFLPLAISRPMAMKGCCSLNVCAWTAGGMAGSGTSGAAICGAWAAGAEGVGASRAGGWSFGAASAGLAVIAAESKTARVTAGG